MDTIKLKHFCSVVETGSLTKAARLCGISHPGIHKSLKALENELNINLTVPDGRGISITPEGKALYQKALEVLKTTEDLIQAMGRQGEHVYRFGMSENFCFSLPGEILRELKNENFTFHERCPGDLEPNIASGHLDFGVTTMPKAHSGINFKEIGKVDFGLYGLHKSDWEKKTFITPTSLYGIDQRDHWKEEIFSRKNVLKVNMLSMGIELMLEGRGLLFMPRFLGEYIKASRKSSRLIKVSVNKELEVSVPLYFLSRSNEKNSDLNNQLVNVIQQHCLK